MATRVVAHEQRATLLRTPISSEVAPPATSEARGSVTDEKMSPQRPRSAAPPWPVRSTAAARATATALSEAVRPLSGAVRQATGLEERPLAVAVAGEVTTIAGLKLKVSWTNPDINPSTWLSCRTASLAHVALATPLLGSPLDSRGHPNIPKERSTSSRDWCRR